MNVFDEFCKVYEGPATTSRPTSQVGPEFSDHHQQWAKGNFKSVALAVPVRSVLHLAL